ncbi:hypothetical protein QBC34DRAFT_428293 [Podospora aff. communis PSN243]|uniref:Uncharacterized protein n=1 Tax=Podospora aff. communis PSN243 TaxID=3040156 RepID=A0AAV9GBL3_9PEZI|nr:hypothetical protein QBC34DRAFT_428293 [Podospora aff. communis PSN243]
MVFTASCGRTQWLRAEQRAPDVTQHEYGLLAIFCVVHIINPIPDPYFQQNFHYRKFLPLRCSIQCLFARFAWTVFSPNVMSHFLNKCITRRKLLVRDPRHRSFDPRGTQHWPTPASPRKRKMPGEADSGVSFAQYDTPFSDVSDKSQGDSEWPTKASPSRGRSMKRRWASVAQKRAKAGLEAVKMR